MSLVSRTLADYKWAFARVGEDIAVRRYSGEPGARTYADTTTRARVTGFSPNELNNSIIQGDRKVVVLAAPLMAAGFSLPITVEDKLIVRGIELAIIATDDSTRRVNGTLMAIDIQARGA